MNKNEKLHVLTNSRHRNDRDGKRISDTIMLYSIYQFLALLNIYLFLKTDAAFFFNLAITNLAPAYHSQRKV